jgi:hypothetical protein
MMRNSAPGVLPLLALLSVASCCPCRSARQEGSLSQPDPVPRAVPADSGGKPLLKPGKLAAAPALASGEARTTVEGCLARQDKGAAPAATRSASDPEESVQVSGHPWGVQVRHVLRHACCLDGATSVTVEASSIVVRETLTGTPCRCICTSTLTSAVGAGIGSYAVTVILELPGSTAATVYEGTVEVKPLDL